MDYLFNKIICLIGLSFLFLFSFNANAGCPALFYAVMDQDEEIVRTYLEYEADPNISLENCPFSEFALKLPSSRNKKNPLPIFDGPSQEDIFIDYPEGTTLLHIAAYMSAYSDFGIYFLLLIYGANENVLDENSNSPRDLMSSKLCISPDDLQLQACLF